MCYIFSLHMQRLCLPILKENSASVYFHDGIHNALSYNTVNASPSFFADEYQISLIYWFQKCQNILLFLSSEYDFSGIFRMSITNHKPLIFLSRQVLISRCYFKPILTVLVELYGISYDVSFQSQLISYAEETYHTLSFSAVNLYLKCHFINWPHRNTPLSTPKRSTLYNLIIVLKINVNKQT